MRGRSFIPAGATDLPNHGYCHSRSGFVRWSLARLTDIIPSRSLALDDWSTTREWKEKI
jgi:hypothetical protein